MLFMPVDYHRIVLPFVEEAFGLATLLIPEPKAEPTPVLTDVEAAELNTERIKLVKKLVLEMRQETACPRCAKKIESLLPTINELETEIPSYEKIARLRQNLRQLLDEVKTGLPLLSEQQMASLKTEEKVAEETKGS